MDESEKWYFCAVGNIVKTRIDEKGIERHGTAAYRPGAKVYLQGKFWDKDNKEIDVIGLTRANKYRAMRVPVEVIENVRASRVYTPQVLDIMDDFEFFDCWWHKRSSDRREINEFIDRWNSLKNEDNGDGMSIYREIMKSDINWEAVEKEIIALGDRINEVYDDDTYLSELYSNYDGDGNVLTEVTKLFIKHGYDVKANNGYNGVRCLCVPNWSCINYHILEAVEVLLDAGAALEVDNYIKDMDDSKSFSEAMSWGRGTWMDGEFEKANILEAYFELIAAYEDRQPYKGIRAYTFTNKSIRERVGFDKVSAAYYRTLVMGLCEMGIELKNVL